MAGLLDFAARFGTEERCIEHLAGLRWPSGFVCSGCSGRMAWRLEARPDKSLVVAAVEKVPVPNNKKGKYGHAVKRQHGFFAGNTRIAVLRPRRASNSAPSSGRTLQPNRIS